MPRRLRMGPRRRPHKENDPRVPYAGCECDTCYLAREQAHGEKLANMFGFDPEEGPPPPVEPQPGQRCDCGRERHPVTGLCIEWWICPHTVVMPELPE